jgi:DnaK suppressor protein
MDRRRLKGFRQKLLEKKQAIVETYNKNKEYGKAADEQGAQDIADKASSSYTKEFLFSLSNSERETINLVEEALARVETPGFGVCASCEGDVERKRLEAVPWARHCISCQEKHEQGLL